MTDEQNERAAHVWREACAACEDGTAAVIDLPMRDMVIAGDQAATAVIAREFEALEAENARLREALEAEDAYWAASRAHACALPRLSEQSGFVFQAARDRRDAARAALGASHDADA